MLVKLRHWSVLLVILVLILLIFFSLTIYFFAFKATSKSYSLVQSWNEYYSVEDWNLAMHAILDLDNDGKKDIITFTNCAFLSSVAEESIPFNSRCEEPSMSVLVFRDNTTSVGQKLTSQKSFRYQWLKKSYLVKTQDDVWKYYDMNGLQLRTYELGNDLLFKEVEPTFLDKIDVLTYQISHLGIVYLLIILPK